ncbi:sigma factor-like helix-turn-helix DNA-binding protein [Catenulispora pinisilvae]|uniref:sigma factor-like helix-turn-helix DNA-binding protein n=1 Tax=Catenulispora pinisilvae TaxID=2705253 RepID=UPI001892104B|nr:sigma factor-like helix-turn-helix DNA-binding protein [Catenulispora pinisilvae]
MTDTCVTASATVVTETDPLCDSTALCSTSPLHAVETAFAALSLGEAPLTLPAALLGEAAPAGADQLTLAELRDLMAAKASPLSPEARDAVWAELVHRSRTIGAVWTVAACGMALPALRKLAAGYARSFDGLTEDLDAEILTGFLDRLAVVEIGKAGIFPDLWWAARRAASHTAAAEIDFTRHTTGFVSAPPPAPVGHEDLVLARACRHGVITAEDAELIGMTRLDGKPLAEAAELLGASRNAVKIRRQRAEARLVAWIAGRRVPNQTALARSRGRA